MSARTAWQPAPLLWLSALVHVGALACWMAWPDRWPWALGAVLANHLLLTAAGLWPRSACVGVNWTRLPAAAEARGEVAITIDDGPDPQVTPRVLEILDHHGAHATFFVVGTCTLEHPQLAREIVRRGHVLENHSYRHPLYFSIMGPWRMAAEVRRAQEVIAATGGQVPQFFRAPAGLRNVLLDPVLARLHLRLASWTRRGYDTRNRNPDSVFDKLVRGLRAGDILLLHDGHAALAPSGTPVILEVLPRLLAEMSARGLRPVTLRAAFATGS